MTRSVIDLLATFAVNDVCHNVTMLSVAFSYCYAELRYAEWHYAECRYTGCPGALKMT
jgi:hypothetical protein